MSLTEMVDDPVVAEWFEKSVSPKALRFLFDQMEKITDIQKWNRGQGRIVSRVYGWQAHRNGKSHHAVLYSQPKTVYLLFQAQNFDPSTWKTVYGLIIRTLRGYLRTGVLELSENTGVSIRLWDSAFAPGSQIPAVLEGLFAEIKKVMEM